MMHSCTFLTSLYKDTHIHVHTPRHTRPQVCPSALIGPCTPTHLHGGAQAPPPVCAPMSRCQTFWGRDCGEAHRGREEAEVPEAGGGGTAFWSSKSPEVTSGEEEVQGLRLEPSSLALGRDEQRLQATSDGLTRGEDTGNVKGVGLGRGHSLPGSRSHSPQPPPFHRRQHLGSCPSRL